MSQISQRVAKADTERIKALPHQPSQLLLKAEENLTVFEYSGRAVRKQTADLMPMTEKIKDTTAWMDDELRTQCDKLIEALRVLNKSQADGKKSERMSVVHKATKVARCAVVTARLT